MNETYIVQTGSDEKSSYRTFFTTDNYEKALETFNQVNIRKGGKKRIIKTTGDQSVTLKRFIDTMN